MKKLTQKIQADKELAQNAYQHIKAQLDKETSRPAARRNYAKIAELSEELCGLADCEPADNGVDKLYSRIYEYEKERRKPTVRILRRIIPVVCAAAILVAANCAAVSAFGRNVFSVVIDFAKNGFSIDFSRQYTVIDLPTSENDPYGIIAECARYGIVPETPHYLPEGFELGNITHNENSSFSSVTFDFYNAGKSISIAYDMFEDGMGKVGIPSDNFNISETKVNGHTAIISKEDNQFTITYQSGNIITLIFTQDVDYDECDKIVASMR